jgi:phytoene desaturase
MLNMIPHLEHQIGTFLPVKGIHQITDDLYALALELGVSFNFSQEVEEILVERNSARGIRTKTAIHFSDLVVSNMDIMLTYRKLLTKQKAPERILRQERSTSALIFYWGIRKRFDQLGLHNILFSNDYPGEFKALFDGKTAFHDPTVYISVTSKDVPDDAPPGCENWFVMVNAPDDKGQDWDKLIHEYRKAIIRKINNRFDTQVEELIEVEQILTPPDIEKRTSSYGGSLYGNASNNKFSAFLRHTNNSNRIKNLYFCGGSVHPGGGIPLCLLSAKISTDLCPNP